MSWGTELWVSVFHLLVESLVFITRTIWLCLLWPVKGSVWKLDYVYNEWKSKSTLSEQGSATYSVKICNACIGMDGQLYCSVPISCCLLKYFPVSVWLVCLLCKNWSHIFENSPGRLKTSPKEYLSRELRTYGNRNHVLIGTVDFKACCDL